MKNDANIVEVSPLVLITITWAFPLKLHSFSNKGTASKLKPYILNITNVFNAPDGSSDINAILISSH